MKRIIALLVLMAFVVPANAGMVKQIDPVEEDLKAVEKPAPEQKIKSPASEPTKQEQAVEPRNEQLQGYEYKETRKKSTMWKWVLGIGITVGLAVAASGGGGDDGGGGGDGDTGSVGGSW